MWPVTVYLPPEHLRRKYVGDWFRAMLDSAQRAGIKAEHIHNMKEPADTALTWGWIRPGQSSHFHASIVRMGVDFGYWKHLAKQPHDYPMRVTVNAGHPHGFVHGRDWPPDRWDALGLVTRTDFDPAGPIILVGQGRKSVWMYGEKPGEWETRKLNQLRAAYPGRDILFRAKPGRGHLTNLGNAPLAEGKIEHVLRGAALVVCRHSNVALDAILAGVPVVCEDGLASAVCPRELPEWKAIRPLSQADRMRVLHASAWWQWTGYEAAQGHVWRFLRAMVDGKSPVY